MVQYGLTSHLTLTHYIQQSSLSVNSIHGFKSQWSSSTCIQISDL